MRKQYLTYWTVRAVFFVTGVFFLLSKIEAQPNNTCINPALINLNSGCPTVYAPVCGCNGITYANSCQAQSSGGVTQWSPNACNTCGISISANVTPAYCNSASGNICFYLAGTGSGLVSTVTYVWQGGGTSGTGTGSGTTAATPAFCINNLTQGTYFVSITTASGCVTSVSVYVPGAANATNVGLNAQLTVQQPGCNLNNGSVCGDIMGGTAPFTIVFNNLAPITVIPSVANADFCFNNLSPGTYSLTITDANGCGWQQTVTLVGTTLTATVNVSYPNCGLGTACVQTPTLGGPYTYQWFNQNGTAINTTPGTNPACLPNLQAGVYSVVVTSASGCSVSQTFSVSPTALTLQHSVQQTGCNVFNVCAWVNNTSNTTASLNFVWTNANGGVLQGTPFTGNNSLGSCLNNVGPGTYTVTVGNTAGCTVTQTIVVQGSSNPVTIAVNLTNGSCGANSSGCVSASGGTPPYTWSFFSGCMPAYPSSIGAITLPPLPNLFTSPPTVPPIDLNTTMCAQNIPPGSYTVAVQDAAGCHSVTCVQVTAGGGLNVNVNITQPVCGGTNGVVCAQIQGGTMPYTINWSGPQLVGSGGSSGSNFCIQNVPAGVYTLNIADAAGCTYTQTVLVNATGSNSTLSATVLPVTCFGGNNGSINLNVANATGVVCSFSWTGPGGFTATTEDIGNLAAGVYSVAVTCGNCTTNATYTVMQPPQLTINVQVWQPSCTSTNSTPNACATINGGTPPYTVAWFTANGASAGTAATPNNCLSGLAQGVYYAVVTDANACTASSTFTIQPATVGMSAQVTLNQPGCSGMVTACALVTGGTAPYTYNWYNTWGTTPLPINANTVLSNCVGINQSGNYMLVVTGANGCTASVSFTVNVSSAMGVNVSITQPGCGGNATACATVTGGVAPFTYNWTTANGVAIPPSSATGACVNNLTSGVYTVVVSGGNGCTAAHTFTVNAASPLTVNILPANTGGLVCAQASGGAAPYQYTWYNPAGISLPNIGLVNSCLPTASLPPGSYTVQVTDANGCVISATITINTPPVNPGSLTLLVNATNASCGQSNGAAIATTSGGTPPYSYLWSTGATTAGISGLMPGVYAVTATDANGQQATQNATVGNTATLQVNMSANNLGVSPATALYNVVQYTVAPVGGTAPYNYVWTTTGLAFVYYNNTGGLSVFTIANAGFSITVTDANGCQAVVTVDATNAAALAINNASITPATGGGVNDGAIDISVSGGTGPYTYLWNNGQTTQDISGLAPGWYMVLITDANSNSVVGWYWVGNSATSNNGGGAKPDIGNLLPKMIVYPNPATTHATLVVDALAGQEGTLRVYDYTGKEIASYNNLQIGSQIGLNLSSYSPGLYLLVLQDANGHSSVQKLSLLR